jgi:hypothetical protein
MYQSLETRASSSGRLTGTAWVHGALQRLIGEVPELRQRLRTPEEITAEEAAPIITRLTQTFKKAIDPRTQRTSFSVQPPTLVIDGGATGLLKSGGALIALHDRTKHTVQEVLTAVDRIVPIDPRADLVELQLTRTVIRSNLEALLREVQQEPRQFQMQSLFESLLGPRTDAGRFGEGGGYIGQLQKVAGLGSAKTRLTGDFEQYTRFLLIRQSLESLADAWDGWRRDAQEGELGVQFVRVGWLFQAVRETVAMFRDELDELGLGDATRWTLQVAFNGKKSEDPHHPISLGSFLDVIDVESQRWSQLLSESGSVGAVAIRDFVGNIHDLVRRATPEFMVQEKEMSHTKGGGEAGRGKPGTTVHEVRHLRAAFETAQHRLDTLLDEIEYELRTSDAAVPYEDRSTLKA